MGRVNTVIWAGAVMVALGMAFLVWHVGWVTDAEEVARLEAGGDGDMTAFEFGTLLSIPVLVSLGLGFFFGGLLVRRDARRRGDHMTAPSV